jgi:hypothetical protein
MTHLGEMLLHVRNKEGNFPLVLFKSDIAEAYRLLPVHPYWQIKQINTIDGERLVDRNNCFGGRGSGAIFIAFDSLVTWIAKNVKLIPYLGAYSDDSFGIDQTENLIPYKKYNKLMPEQQVKLLCLWDELGIPHEERKQIWGAPLTVIGIDVDPNKMTLSLPPDRRTDLIAELRKFCLTTPRRRGASFSLREWQRLAGWMNWGLNVYPLLRPALNRVYPKIAGEDQPLRKIWVNNAVRADLTWAADHLESLSGVQLLRSQRWSESDADIVAYCDACLDGLGCWFPDHHVGFYADIPEWVASDIIFYFEALSVATALDHLAHVTAPLSKILIYTDNANTVSIFSSLRCLPAFNPLIKHCADILITKGYLLRVCFVPGEDNEVADAVSRKNFSLAKSLAPGLQIGLLTPPRFKLGVAEK